MRQLRYGGVEVVRGIDCPIRDPNWATETPADVEETIDETSDGVVLSRRFAAFDGALSADLEVRLHANGVAAKLRLHAHRRVETNRAGFTLLHPIQGVSGKDVIIRHSDGTEGHSTFPEAISPGQPAFDIVGLRHVVDGIAVDIRFTGEVFEMEDQRNWTDASYKTYCRPLGLGFPYTIEAGETVEQSIEISLSVAGTRAQPGAESNRSVGPLPEIAIAFEPDWFFETAPIILECLPTAYRILRLDVAREYAFETLAALAGPVELEVVIDDEGNAAGRLHTLAKALRDTGITVESVTALPRAYLKSYQPTAEWPAGHGIVDAAAWAKAAFPDAETGIGMLTNFTEFNRHPPPSGIGDFTTYSTTAIVHAGDDLSVFETLEALSHVHESARLLSGERPVRLGLTTIGMRSNPYGAAVADNPKLARMAMAMDDPRQQSTFAATFAVGAYSAAAASKCARVGLASAGGPFATGQVQDGAFRAWPIHHVVRALAELAGKASAALPDMPSGVMGVGAESAGKVEAVIANCSVEPKRLDFPAQHGVVMDGATAVSAPDWLDRANAVALDDVLLAPASVVFIFRGGDR
ncbi:MAG: hypothetical protein AAGK37_16575 [Pseudomonadota bacterium]